MGGRGCKGRIEVGRVEEEEGRRKRGGRKMREGSKRVEKRVENDE